MSNRKKEIAESLEAMPSASDQLLSSLLEDLLCNHSPPDVKSKVLAKLMDNGGERDAQIQSEWDSAIRLAANDIADGYGVVIPPPVVLNRTDEPELSAWIRRGVIVAATLAAAVLGALFIPNALRSFQEGSNQTEIVKDAIKPQVDVTAPGLAAQAPNEGGLPRIVQPEVVRTDALATNLEKPKGSASNTKTLTNVVSNAMTDSDVISVIDNQLSYLWKRVGAVPAAEVQTDLWLDRTAVAVLGRPATAAEKEAFRLNRSDNKAASYVDGLVSSDEFARYWSARLAEHYLGKRLRANRDGASLEQSFVDMLKEAVSQKTFVGDIERRLIAPFDNSGSPSVVLKEASAYWLAETMERAASIQREWEDSDSIIKKREPREESLLGVSRQLMRLSGNPSLVCSQCHTDETGSSDLRGFVAMSSGRSQGGSSSFWSVPASLSGLSLAYKNSERTLQLEAAKDYFYEDAEGMVKLAVAGPPTLSRNKNATESLADWFSGSSEPRRALVEMVWNQVFQQPLVPLIGLSEAEGLSERVDLRDLLASQMQTRKADLGSLVRWVVLSKATRLQGLKTDANWYLKSPESQIIAAQKQMRIFAGYPRAESVQVESGKLAMNKVTAWYSQKRSFQKSDALLAQGVGGTSTIGSAPLKLDYSEDQVRYLISIDEPYSHVKSVSDRLAKSSMKWPMLVEHAYLATDARFPTRAEREEAAKLLEAARNDRMKTMVMIVTARLGSW